MKNYDVIIVGGGIVGASIAYLLADYDLRVCLAERKSDVAMGTTRANSAILHAGYDPEPGTVMARTNVRGNVLAKEICTRLGVHYNEIGSLVVALNDTQMQTVKVLYDRGVANGVPDMEIWDAERLLKEEPNISPEAKGALYAPTAAVVNPWQYCIAMCNYAHKNGVDILLDSPVTAVKRTSEGFEITAGNDTLHTRYIVNAAGLFAGDVDALVTGKGFKTRAVRGEYYLLDKACGDLVSRVIFPCPDKAGKGVVVSPTVHGNLLVGPNAMEVAQGEDVATSLEGQDTVRQRASATVVGVPFNQNIRNFAGNRAYIDGDDFDVCAPEKGYIRLGGIKSPGLTAAPALAEEVLALLEKEGLALAKKEAVKAYRFPKLFRDCSPEEQAALIEKDARHGRVICRCETITEGDIVTALEDGFTPPTVSAVKRRCNAGMGRCQGGFCSIRVHEIIAKERGMAPEAVTLDGGDSYIVIGETKGGGAL